ncbi:MAG: MFS transporter [Pseudomonadota bacterium]|nr:MFS transporter [Pseudomonadota bacterium]
MRGPFAPLRHTRFRALWLAGLVSFLGTWVHNVAARWTAATLSPSPLAVSAVDALQLAPMVLLSLFAGNLADALDRRRLLIATHAGLAVVVALMGVLAAMDALSLPVLLALTCGLGVLGALNGPAWQATVPRQVPDNEVPKAVALMSTGFNLARAVGPAAGAWMLVAVGPAAAFFTNAASYMFIGLLLWRLPPQPPAVNNGPVRSPLSEPGLVRLYAVGLAFGLFAMPSLSLLPVVARDALHGDAESYGNLLSAFGLGAVSAGLLVASAVRRFGNRPFIAATTVVSAAGLGVLSVAHTLPHALVGAGLSGIGWIGTISTVNAGVQMRAPPEVRARALAYYLTFAVGGQATGSALGGWLASHVGLPVAFRLSAAALLVVAAVVLAGYRRLPEGS